MNENRSGRRPQEPIHPHSRAAAQRRRRNRRTARLILAWGVVAVVAVALVIGIPKLLAQVPAGASVSASVGSDAAESGTAAQAADSTQSTARPTEEAQSTSAPPKSTAEPAAEKPESEAQPVAQESGFTCTWDTTGQEGYDYLLAVNRAANCVTVFTKDAEGNYTVPYKAMVASSGDATPVGSYNTIENYRWRFLQGDVYGQYATRITGHILFHSVPYFSQDQSDLEYEEFNKLGTAASLGCIRLQVVDAKWIYDNCAIGTPTVLYDDAACPGPLGKPDFPRIDVNDEARRGWDPTDPDEANPWNAQ